MIRIKAITHHDLSMIRQIAYTTWPNTFGSMLPPDQMGYMLNLIYNDESLIMQMACGQTFLLIEKENVAVGFCSYQINYPLSGQLMIHKLYLLPDAQGLSIGTKVLNHLGELAKLNNNSVLRLKVFYLNNKAIHFYLKNGFVKVGEETNLCNNYDPIIDIVMLKKI
ncbi:MAG: GNAT family N-acetyltransferase [Chitinophagaceae bacterium]|nr:GNAT family N-acetyltransferase [Chitinophagaceae bacterium]